MSVSTQTNEYANPRWDDAAQQFTQLIGYKKNRKKVRVRKRFYFQSHEKSAIRMSIEAQKKWEQIVADCKKRNAARRLISPDVPLELPEWPEEGTISDDNRVVGNRSKSTSPTIAQAKDKFLEAQKARVGLSGGIGLKPATYNGVKTMVTIALGLSTAKIKAQVTRKPIDVDMPLNSITKVDLENFRNFWMGLPDGISVRTAINYCAHFKQLIDWCDSNEEFGFNKPKATDDLFVFRGMKKSKVEKFDADKLRKLLDAALLNTDKALLYVLLALQCGHYQADIGNLLQSDLKVIGDEAFLWRKRTKRTGVNEEVDGDDDAEEHALQYLWPETYSLLQKHMAPKGQPQMLLNQNGEPLYDEKVDERKRDNIGEAYERVQATAGVKMHFRQFRKLTWNAIKRIGNGNLDLARKWSGQKVPGVAQAYNVDEFDDVTAALKKWREELIAAKVLPVFPAHPAGEDPRHRS